MQPTYLAWAGIPRKQRLTLFCSPRSMEDIASDISLKLGFPIDDLITVSRKKEPKEARQIVMYVLRQRYKDGTRYRYSLDRIGLLFNRDHTTVIHSVQTMQDLMDTEPHTKQKVQALLED